MTTPYVGEIRVFAFPRIPTGWFACNGSLISISEYQVLFTLLGTTYGGDGANTFGLPDLRGQVPVHQGKGPNLTPRFLGEFGGNENVTLLQDNMPSHNHNFRATLAAATTATPGPTLVPGTLPSDRFYDGGIPPAASPLNMAASFIGQAGGSQPHGNLMPTLTLSACIAWAGIFPSRN